MKRYTLLLWTSRTMVLVLFLWMATAGCVFAEDSVPAKLSLADAVAAALGTNANLKRDEESHESSLSRLRVASLNSNFEFGSTASLDRSDFNSDLSGVMFSNYSYENLIGTQAALELSPFSIGNSRSALSLSVRHPLMRGRGLLSEKSDKVLGAKSQVSAQSKGLFVSRQSTVLSVVESYYGAILAREKVKVQENAVSIAEEVADGTRKKVAEGLVPEIEVSRADIRVARTKDQLNLQKQAERGAIDRLMLAIGDGVGQTPELTDTVPDVAEGLPDITTAIKTALANRLELQVLDEQLIEQQRKLAITKDRLRPGFDIVAGINSTNNDTGLFSGSALRAGALTAGFEYRVPLDRRIILEDQSTAKRELNVLGQLRDYQIEETIEQVRQAYRRLETSKASLKIFTENLEVARDNLRLAQRMVEEGIDDNRNVLEAQDSLVQTESGILSAKSDLYLSAINLKYYMGEDLTTMGEK